MSVLVNTVFCFFDCGFVCLLKIMFFLSKFTGHMNWSYFTFSTMSAFPCFWRGKIKKRKLYINNWGAIDFNKCWYYTFFLKPVLKPQQTEYKRIISPLKYQTRCVAAFPDQQGFLVCIHFSLTFEYTYSNRILTVSLLFYLLSSPQWCGAILHLVWSLYVHAAKSLYSLRML